MKLSAPTTEIALSRLVERVRSHPEQPEARNPMPRNAMSTVQTPSVIPMPSKCSSRARPAGRTVKVKGMRKAVIVYFQAIMVVLIGVAAGDRRGGKRRQGRGRRDLGEQGVVEDEHVGGVVRHPQLGQTPGPQSPRR